MPPKGRKRASEVDDHVSDDGFVDDVDEDDKPKAKKARTQRATERSTTGPLPGGAARDDDGVEYWELSKNRRVTISQFQGKDMVSLREYYSKDDKMLPGKKGISLPLEQYFALITALPHIETVLTAKGHTVPRPSYAEENNAPLTSRDAGGREGRGKQSTKAKNSNGANKKRNFEATSDEDEDGGVGKEGPADEVELEGDAS